MIGQPFATLRHTPTANQERELRAVAEPMGCEIIKVYKDQGVSGAKGRNGRPAFDALCKAANRREFALIMAWSVDRLERAHCKRIGAARPLAACGPQKLIAAAGRNRQRNDGAGERAGGMRRYQPAGSRAQPAAPMAARRGPPD
jgi:hypothetical protein